MTPPLLRLQPSLPRVSCDTPAGRLHKARGAKALWELRADRLSRITLTSIKEGGGRIDDAVGAMNGLATVETVQQNSNGNTAATEVPTGLQGRLEREWRTIAAMVRCYCRDHHQPGAGICLECQGLLDYAGLRLARCQFGEEKPTCAKCPVHCYQKVRREQVRVIMRYAGPRMLWEHPILSLRHWMDSFRRAP